MTTILHYGHKLTMEIADYFCEYGNYVVRVKNSFDHTGFLYDDASIRRALIPTSKRSVKKLNGFYFTTQEAQAAIDKFKELRGDKTMTQTNGIDSQLRGILDNTLAGFVSNGKMFTAFDVTREVRDANPNLHVFHNVVKAYVHGDFESGQGYLSKWSYDRILLPIATPMPWLYYVPGTHDPDTYQGDKSQQPEPKSKGTFRKAIEAMFGGIRGACG